MRIKGDRNFTAEDIDNTSINFSPVKNAGNKYIRYNSNVVVLAFIFAVIVCIAIVAFIARPEAPINHPNNTALQKGDSLFQPDQPKGIHTPETRQERAVTKETNALKQDSLKSSILKNTRSKNKIIYGSVYDPSGNPLPEVIVTLYPYGIMDTTDRGGMFQISVDADVVNTDILEMSFTHAQYGTSGKTIQRFPNIEYHFIAHKNQ